MQRVHFVATWNERCQDLQVQKGAPSAPHRVEWRLAPDLSLSRKLAYGPLLTACPSDLPLWSGLVAGTRKCSLAACRCLIPGKAPTPNLLAVFEFCLFKPNPPYLKPHCNTHCGGVGEWGDWGGLGRFSSFLPSVSGSSSS